MANKSKFINIQQDPCEIVLPEEQTIDRVCPTCVPSPSYIPPEWWKQTEPWLNEKTCDTPSLSLSTKAAIIID